MIPSLPFPRQFSQDPGDYARTMNIQPGAPLAGEAGLLPTGVIGRSEKDSVGLMDAPARAAMSEPDRLEDLSQRGQRAHAEWSGLRCLQICLTG